MNMKNIARAVSAAVVLASASVSASAATILDGWSLTLPGAYGTISNIGRMNLFQGNATVYQEVNASGNAFQNARFTESGQIFNLTFTTEDTPGAGDGSVPGGGDTQVGMNQLQLTFTDVLGHVTEVRADGSFHYTFDSGLYTIAYKSTPLAPLASGTIVGLGGNAAATRIIGGVNGDSTLLGNVLFTAPGVFFRDNMGNNLAADLATGAVLYQAVTNNNVTNTPVGAACPFTPFASTSSCITFNVASGGDAYLVRAVPEPGTLALAGVALLGLGTIRRRRRSSAK